MLFYSVQSKNSYNTQLISFSNHIYCIKKLDLLNAFFGCNLNLQLFSLIIVVNLIVTESDILKMADRKAELERKRAKLNALREEKERKKKEKEQQVEQKVSQLMANGLSLYYYVQGLSLRRKYVKFKLFALPRYMYTCNVAADICHFIR